jgi:subtilisin-like proprotein convertase family protein
MSNRFKCLIVYTLLSSSHILFAQTYEGTGGLISDDGQINDFNIYINDLDPGVLTDTFGLVTVCINIAHSWIADLDIRLVTPGGSNIMLTSGLGGDTDFYEFTCFNMTAARHILNGSSPYNGAYRPFTPIGNANNDAPGNGKWTLRILDTYAYADAGEVLSWSLNFGNNPPERPAFVPTALPIIVLETDNITIPNEPKIPGRIKVIQDPSGGLNSYPGNLTFESNMSIEVRGSSSQGFPKKNFSFETQDEEGQGLDTTLLGLPKEEDWILYGPYTDKSMLRDALTYYLGRALGGYAPRAVACEVVLNDDYHGVYWLEEKIKRDKNRVDIKKLNPEDTLGNALTGGYILKVDRDDGEGSYFVSEYEGTYDAEEIRIVYEDPEGPDLHPKQKAYIQSFFHAFEDALYGNDFTDPQTGYRRYVDVNSVIDYFLVCELGHNVDAYRLSTFFYKDKDSEDSLMHMGPLWDFNLAFGNVDYCNCQHTYGWAYENSGGCGNTPRWWTRFLEDPYFQDRLRCRYDSLRETVLSTGAVLGWLDEQADILGGPAEPNYDRWPILGMYIWPNNFIGQTYSAEVNYMKQWVNQRLQWMDENLPGLCEPVSASHTIASGELILQPNPTSGNFSIQLDAQYGSIESVMIYSVTGSSVMHFNFPNPGESLDIQHLASGAYMVNILMTNGAEAREMLLVQ